MAARFDARTQHQRRDHYHEQRRHKLHVRRLIAGIEQSLETLRADGIIAGWSYVEDVDLLLRYKWLEPWLDYHVAVTLKP